MRYGSIAWPSDTLTFAFEYINEQYREPQTTAEASGQLDEIRRHGEALLDDLRRARGATIDALNAIGRKAGHNLRKIEVSLEWLVDAATSAKPHHGVKDHKGPARAESARKIARQAANDYFDITKSPPRRSRNRDGFPDFLSAMFAACRVDEDSRSFEEEATRAWADSVQQ